MAATKRVALVGAALSDIGRVDTKTPFELHYQAASRAIADAGLTKDDIDGFGSSGMGLLAPVEIAEYLGLRPTWVDGTGVGGSTWEFMVEHATAGDPRRHVETVVLVYGSTTRADLKAQRRSANLSFGARGPVQFDTPFGHTLISKYAMATRRHMYEFGTTIEQLAEIAVSTRYNASLNPEAYYRDPITIDDVQSSRDDRRSAHEAALLHPQRRRRRDRAHHRGAGPRPRQGTRCGCSAPARRRRTRR